GDDMTFCLVAHILRKLLDKLHNIDLGGPQYELVSIDPGNVQQLVDQALHAVALLAQGNQGTRGLRSSFLDLARQHLSIAFDSRQRGTQLVGDNSEELVLELVQLDQTGNVGCQRDRADDVAVSVEHR